MLCNDTGTGFVCFIMLFNLVRVRFTKGNLLVSPLNVSQLRRPNFGHSVFTSFLSRFFCADELIQFTAVLWLREFLTLSGRAMIPYCASILSAVLPCVSYERCKFSILLKHTIILD